MTYTEQYKKQLENALHGCRSLEEAQKRVDSLGENPNTDYVTPGFLSDLITHARFLFESDLAQRLVEPPSRNAQSKL